MKLTAYIWIGLMLSTSLTCAQAKSGSDSNSDSDAATLTQIEYNIGRAIIKKNPGMLEAIFGDDFFSYSGEAQKQNKQSWIANSMSPKLTITAFRYSPFDIRIFGATAVVQGSNEDDARYDGKDIHATYTWLDVFVKREGRWLLVANETVTVAEHAEKRAGVWTLIAADAVAKMSQ